jgi:hypothetical protein
MLMRRDTAHALMAAGAVLLLIWFVAVLLHFLVRLALYAGLVLVIIGAVIYLAQSRR